MQATDEHVLRYAGNCKKMQQDWRLVWHVAHAVIDVTYSVRLHKLLIILVRIIRHCNPNLNKGAPLRAMYNDWNVRGRPTCASSCMPPPLLIIWTTSVCWHISANVYSEFNIACTIAYVISASRSLVIALTQTSSYPGDRIPFTLGELTTLSTVGAFLEGRSRLLRDLKLAVLLVPVDRTWRCVRL